MNAVTRAKEISDNYRIPSCHSDFQIQNFIIGKETSVYGKMWQCVREIQSRYDSLEACEQDILETQDNIELAEISLQRIKLKNTFSTSEELEKLKTQRKLVLIRKKERQVNKIRLGLQLLNRKKNDLIQELEVFTKLFDEFSSKVQYLPFNDNKAQTEYWNNKFDNELNIAAMFGAPANLELIKSCLALPDETKVKKQILGAITNLSKKLIGPSN